MSSEGTIYIQTETLLIPKQKLGQPRSASQEIIIEEAESLFVGTTTLARLLDVYDKDAIREIIQHNNRLNSDDPNYLDPAQGEDEQLIPKISHILSIIAEYKEVPRTESSEEKFINLVGVLRKNDRFRELLLSYEPLMEQKPDWTEVYELKAISDLIELYPELLEE